MTIPVVLYVRTNLDWGTLTEETFLRQEERANSVRAMSADQKQTLLNAIQLWNRTFGVSYFAYRQRLKEIAELNWTRIRNLDLVVRRQDLLTILEHVDRFIVLPVDDDDWFHPDVADILRRHSRPDVDAFHWPDGLYRSVPFQDRFKQTASQDRLVVRHWPGDFATNGYALTRTGLSRCNTQTRQRVLAFHWEDVPSAGVHAMLDRPAAERLEQVAGVGDELEGPFPSCGCGSKHTTLEATDDKYPAPVAVDAGVCRPDRRSQRVAVSGTGRPRRFHQSGPTSPEPLSIAQLPYRDSGLSLLPRDWMWRQQIL